MYARPYEDRGIYKVVRKENRRRREEKSARKEVLLEQ
jgi:hypothetical protein